MNEACLFIFIFFEKGKFLLDMSGAFQKQQVK